MRGDNQLSGGAIYLTIEDAGVGGQRVRIPRGWVLLTLMLASWGAASFVGLALWGIFGLPLAPLVAAAAGACALLYVVWRIVGKRLFIAWLERSFDEDNR
jgi:hypothetical protein